MRTEAPPRLATRLIDRGLPEGDRREVLDSLAELYAIRLKRSGPLRSAIWYWRQVVSFPAHQLFAQTPGGFGKSGGEGKVVRMFNSFFKDVRYAVRSLLSAPGFTVVAVLALALGIGNITPTFSLINAYILRPLPFEEPERLVHVWGTSRRMGYDMVRVSVPDFFDWREQSESFEDLAAFNYTSEDLTGTDVPEPISSGRVSANAFELLGAEPVLGRGFEPGEDQPGSANVVVLSDRFWENRYGRDPTVLGRTLELNNEAYTIVGVMGSEFVFPLPTTLLWATRKLDETRYPRDSGILQIVGRLAPGATVGQAQAEMDGVAARLAETYPETNEGRGVNITDLRAALNFADEIFRIMAIVLSAAGGFVLLIACGNVSSLLLARGLRRGREVAIRTALGASRAQLIRQFLAESLVLALAAGLVGVAFAYWMVGGLAQAIPDDLYRVGEIEIDSFALIATLGIVLVTALIFGLVPALRISKVSLSESLKEGTAGATSSRGSLRLQKSLVVGQIALALVLLTGTSLMLQNLEDMSEADTGFDSGNVLTMTLALRAPTYESSQQYIDFHREVIESVGNVPGVVAAATMDYLPLNHETDITGYTIPEIPADPNETTTAVQIDVAGDYFEVMRSPLVKGRPFGEQDTGDSFPVTIINETFANRYWPDRDPIGQQIRLDDVDDPVEIIGVVRDIKFVDLSNTAWLQVYRPVQQAPFRYFRVMARTTGEPAEMTAAVREAISRVDPNVPIRSVRTLEQVVADFLLAQQMISVMLAMLSAGAILLASVGIYGVIAFFVSQRTREMSIRMAVGAGRRDVLVHVLKGGARLAALGVAIGLVGALALASAMASFIGPAQGGLQNMLGVGSLGLITFAALPVGLTLVALLACYLPARRATKVDPIVAMRAE